MAFQLIHHVVFRSFSTVLRHVVFGLPLARFPSGCHPGAVLQSSFPSLLRMCPIQFHLLLRTSQLMFSMPDISNILTLTLFPTSNSHTTILVLLRRCCTSALDFHSKNHKLRKKFGKFFRSYSELLLKFGEISFPEYVSEGISHPVFYGDLMYKLRRVKGATNFVLSRLKIHKRLQRRK